MTYHCYYKNCDEDMKKYIDIKNMEICPNDYEPVIQMNEVYMTTFEAEGSDQVFETAHVDGPFGFMPNSLLRCIYVIEPNERVITTIPSKNISKSLKRNEYILFDYNRDLHYIFHTDGDNDDTRVVLKLHFVKIERFYKIFKFMCIYWNYIARYMFLLSQKPNTIFEKTVSILINKITQYYSYFYGKHLC